MWLIARPFNFIATFLIGILIVRYTRELNGPWAYYVTIYTIGLFFIFVGATFKPAKITRQASLTLVTSLWAGIALYPYAVDYCLSDTPQAVSLLVIVLLGWFSLWWIMPRLRDILQKQPFTLNLLVMNVSVVSLIFATFIAEIYVTSHPQVNAHRTGIIYTPHSILQHQTADFTYTAHINNYGFRGDDVGQQFSGDCRVMLIGDSFTFGWGVGFADTWGAQLQNMLSKEMSTEVLNLGYPGVGPQTYSAVVAVAAPLFAPDVIIVGLLQGEDFMQADDVAQHLPELLAGEGLVNQFLHTHYPNITRYLWTSPQNISQQVYRDKWIKVAEEALQKYPNAFDGIDNHIQDLYRTGQLNPYLIAISQNRDYFTTLLDPSHPMASTKIAAMGKALNTINGYAPLTIVASIPFRAYVSTQELAVLGQLGVHTVPDMVTTTAMDDVVYLALNYVDDRQTIRFFETTQIFRETSEILYFHYDGHFNIAGNTLFANQIYPIVYEACSQIHDNTQIKRGGFALP